MRPFPPHSPRFTQELGATLHLAAPIALAMVAQFGMGVTDTIMLGALGREPLAAGGLATGMFFFSGSVLQGFTTAVAILIAHARGGREEHRITPILKAGYALAVIAALPLMVVLWFVEPILLKVGEPAALAANVKAYLHVLMWAAPGFLWVATQRSFLSAMARPQLVLFVSLGALVTNGVLNYGLIHGRFGLPELGFVGSAVASLATIYLQLCAYSVSMRVMRGLPRAKVKGAIAWKIVRELVHLGWPIGITVGVEAGLFFAGALLMGLLGTTSLAAHQVTIQVAATLFMIPLALGQAANVRVGYHAGAGAIHAARTAGFASLTICLATALTGATLTIVFAKEIVLLFGLEESRDAEVIALATRLLAVAAAFQLADGVQAVAAGALRGLKDTRVPMIVAALGYWAVGFPAAWLLAFPLGFGAVGVWWGLALGLAVVAFPLTWRFVYVSGHSRDGASIEDAARMAFAPVAA